MRWRMHLMAVPQRRPAPAALGTVSPRGWATVPGAKAGRADRPEATQRRRLRSLRQLAPHQRATDRLATRPRVATRSPWISQQQPVPAAGAPTPVSSVTESVQQVLPCCLARAGASALTT